MRKRRNEAFEPMVPRDLTDKEQSIKAKELADLCGEIDKLRADARESAATARKAIRSKESRRHILAECVRTGTEMIPAQMQFADNKANGKDKGKDKGKDQQDTDGPH